MATNSVHHFVFIMFLARMTRAIGMVRGARGLRGSALCGSSEGSEGRLLLSFVCKVCATRTARTVSKHAYNHGVVLIQCDGCRNQVGVKAIFVCVCLCMREC